MAERTCSNCRWQGLWRCPLPRDGAVFDWLLSACDRWEPRDDLTGDWSLVKPFPDAQIPSMVAEKESDTQKGERTMWLLTEEEIKEVVKAWMDKDWSTRFVALNRGHWEDVAPVIAQAQLWKVLQCMVDNAGFSLCGNNFTLSNEDWAALRQEAGMNIKDERKEGEERNGLG